MLLLQLSRCVPLLHFGCTLRSPNLGFEDALFARRTSHLFSNPGARALLYFRVLSHSLNASFSCSLTPSNIRSISSYRKSLCRSHTGTTPLSSIVALRTLGKISAAVSSPPFNRLITS